MLLGFLTVVVMAAVAGILWRRGVLPAFATCCNVLGAGLLAFNFFEPLADLLDPMLAGSFLHGCEDCLCLLLLFCLPLGALFWITYLLVPTTIDYPPLLQRGGAVVFGLAAGYLLSGFLLCAAQTLPVREHFLGFETRVDPQAKLRRVLPPDRVWLALMHRASYESLSWDADRPFDPDGSYEMRYGSERRSAD